MYQVNRQFGIGKSFNWEDDVAVPVYTLELYIKTAETYDWVMDTAHLTVVLNEGGIAMVKTLFSCLTSEEVLAAALEAVKLMEGTMVTKLFVNLDEQEYQTDLPMEYKGWTQLTVF